MKKSLVFMLAVVVLGAAGCGAGETESSMPIAAAAQDVESASQTELAASMDDIAGWWKAVQGGVGVMHVDKDGTWILFYDQEPMADGPRAMSEVHFEGSHLLISDTAWGDGDTCDGAGTYQVQRLADGYVRFVAVEDGCQRRMDALQGRGSLSGGIAWRPPFD